MENLNGVNCIKGETNAISILIRLQTRWSNKASRRSSTSNRDNLIISDDDDSLVLIFRQLNEYMEGLFDLKEIDCVTYIKPFHDIIVSEHASGPITNAALSALSKFALYGFFQPHYPRIKEGMALVAHSISHCVFEETDWESDELILMKLLELSTLCYRCNAASMLDVESAWDIFCTCKSIHEHYRASKILKVEAETSLVHLTLNIFTRASQMVLRLDSLPIIGHAKLNPPSMVPDANNNMNNISLTLSESTGLTIMLMNIIKAICNLIDLPKQNTDSIKFGLSLLNVSLEAGGLALSSVTPLVDVLSNDVCRHLLKATQSEDLAVFSSSLRVVFNLFMSIKDHMKVQLEVFLTSVHMRLLNSPAGIALAREELALESLLDFCREPALMQDIYINYDCDVQCTNLFDSIISALCRRATLDIIRDTSDYNQISTESTPTSRLPIPRFTVIHRLALEGIAAVLHGMTIKLIKIGTSQAVTKESTTTGEGNATDEYIFLNSHSKTNGFVNIIAEDILESEIDRWCEDPLESELASQDQSDPYALVVQKSEQSTSPQRKPSLPKQMNDMSLNKPTTEKLEKGTSSAGSSPISWHKLDVASVDSCSEAGSSIVDRENEITNSVVTHSERNKNSGDLRKRKIIKQKLKEIAGKFNQKPLKTEWLESACEVGIIEVVKTPSPEWSEHNPCNADPKSIAKFLKTNVALGKQQIGEFISKGPAHLYPFHAQVLREYVATFTFTENGLAISFDAALRLFLSCFRLPGEAQCIDRIMEAFAARYFEQLGDNKPFASRDAAFILSFSTIMLNTDLHNPQVPVNKKMTKEQFIRNNRGINDGADLPRDYLENLYDHIKDNQIQVDIDMTDSNKLLIDYTDPTTWSKIISKVSHDPARFTPTITARRFHYITIKESHGVNHEEKLWDMIANEADMFITISRSVLQTLFTLWEAISITSVNNINDNKILQKNMSCLVDFLITASGLSLNNLFSTAIQLFLDSSCRYMITMRTDIAPTIKPYSRYNILVSRSIYNQFRNESNNIDLSYLLTLKFDELVSLADYNNKSSSSSNNDNANINKRVDWEHAVVVKGELTLRIIIHMISRYQQSIQKECWIAFFSILFWVRSRAALPLPIAFIPIDFEASEKQGLPLNLRDQDHHSNSRYKPSVYCRSSFLGVNLANMSKSTQADTIISVDGNQPLTAMNSHQDVQQAQSMSWFSYLWSNGDNDSSSSSSSNKGKSPYTHSGLTTTGQDPSIASKTHLNLDAYRCFTNANNNTPKNSLLAESSFNNTGSSSSSALRDKERESSMRTDDWLLKTALEAAPLTEIFQTIFTCDGSNSNRSSYDGLMEVLHQLLQRLVGQSIEFAPGLGGLEENSTNLQVNNSMQLQELFPMQLLEFGDVKFEVHELDAVICLEWLVNAVLSDQMSWRAYGDHFMRMLLLFLGEETELLSRFIPFFLERCAVSAVRCVLFALAHTRECKSTRAHAKDKNLMQIEGKQLKANESSSWALLRLLRDLPHEVSENIADTLATGVSMIIK